MEIRQNSQEVNWPPKFVPQLEFQSRFKTQQMELKSEFWVSRYSSSKLVAIYKLFCHFPGLKGYLWSIIWPSIWHWKYTKLGTLNLPCVNNISTKFHAKNLMGRQSLKQLKFKKCSKANLPSHISFLFKSFVPHNQPQLIQALKPMFHKHPISNLEVIDIKVFEI